MKSEYAGIHIPAGCTMYAGETVDSLVDLGVIPDDVDSQIEITYDVSRVQGSKGETVLESIRNMVAKATTELYQINLEHINMLVGGVMNVTKTAASKVSDEEHVIAKGWAKGALLPLPGRNADGSALVLLMVTRLLPVFPYNLQNFAYGITDVGLLPYTIYTFVFMFPGVALFTVGAAGLSDAENRAGLMCAAAVFAVMLALIGVFLYKRYLKRGRAA